MSGASRYQLCLLERKTTDLEAGGGGGESQRLSIGCVCRVSCVCVCVCVCVCGVWVRTCVRAWCVLIVLKKLTSVVSRRRIDRSIVALT